jgi:hypothetical protein
MQTQIPHIDQNRFKTLSANEPLAQQPGIDPQGLLFLVSTHRFHRAHSGKEKIIITPEIASWQSDQRQRARATGAVQIHHTQGIRYRTIGSVSYLTDATPRLHHSLPNTTPNQPSSAPTPLAGEEGRDPRSEGLSSARSSSEPPRRATGPKRPPLPFRASPSCRHHG